MTLTHAEWRPLGHMERHAHILSVLCAGAGPAPAADMVKYRAASGGGNGLGERFWFDAKGGWYCDCDRYCQPDRDHHEAHLTYRRAVEAVAAAFTPDERRRYLRAERARVRLSVRSMGRRRTEEEQMVDRVIQNHRWAISADVYGRLEPAFVAAYDDMPEQLTLDLGNATVAGVWQPVHTVAAL